MTIDAINHTRQATADGTQTSYTLGFRVDRNDDLKVWSQATGETEATLLVELTDYTIAELGSGDYATEVLADSPYAWYRLGELTGTTAEDSSTNSRDGTYAGGYIQGVDGLVPGQSDTAVRFDGTSGYIDLDDVQMRVPTNTEMTIEAWIRLDSVPTGAGYYVISKDVPSQNGWYLRIDTSRRVAVTFGNSTELVSISALTLNTTYHIVATVYDDATGMAKIYINGVEDRDGFAGSVVLDASGIDSYIGAANNGSNVATSFFDGTIDDVAIYSATMPFERIYARYKSVLWKSVVFTTAPASGTVLTFERDTARDQESDYAALRRLPAETHELFLDRPTMMIQELLNREEDLIITSVTNPGELNSPVIKRHDHCFIAEILTEPSAGVYTWQEVDGGLTTFTGARTGSTARSTGGCKNVAIGTFVKMIGLVDSASGVSYRFLLGGQCGGGGDPDDMSVPNNLTDMGAITFLLNRVGQITLDATGYTDTGLDAWENSLLVPDTMVPFKVVKGTSDVLFVLGSDGKVRRFDYDTGTQEWSDLDAAGGQLGQFSTGSPLDRDIVYDPTNDILLICGQTRSGDIYGNDIVRRITPSTGATLSAITLDSPPVGDSGPKAMDVDSTGNIYIGGDLFQITGLTASGPSHVYKLNPDMSSVIWDIDLSIASTLLVAGLKVMQSGKVVVLITDFTGVSPVQQLKLISADGATVEKTYTIKDTNTNVTFPTFDIDEQDNVYVYMDILDPAEHDNATQTAYVLKLSSDFTLLGEHDQSGIPNFTPTEGSVLRWVTVQSSKQIFLAAYPDNMLIVDWTIDAAPVILEPLIRSNPLNSVAKT